MREKVTISYRGANFEIGRGDNFYGIWWAGAPRSQPSETFPATPEGWYGAWARFTGIETPGTIVPVEQTAAERRAPAAVSATVNPPPKRRALTAAGLLTLGVVLGVVGLFPDYVGGASLSQQPAELVPHVIYFATWIAAAVLIAQGGVRLRVGVLLGLGTSIVTLGLFVADAGTPITGGAHLMGAGLILGLLGWLVCTAGSLVAFRLRSGDAPAKPLGHELGFVLALAVAGIGAAVTFAPSWDSFTLRSAAGASSSLTAGNAFSNPGAIIAGNLITMVALVAVVAIAAFWRPIRLGAALLAGAIIPMAAQAISALVQLGQSVSPTQFGISPAQAARAGITISSGLTVAFWVFCAFDVVLIVGCAKMLITPRRLSFASTGQSDASYTDPPYHTAVTS